MWLLLAVAMLVVLAAPAAAATPSELLQKAIYTEETVGDLDAAMKLYEQVIAEGKSAQEAAAQAQFRLALCLEKKGRDAEAQAAFEAVIENFPNAKELVAQARKHLPSDIKLLPAPWKMGERMQLNMKLPSGLDIGTMIYMVDDAERDGKAVTRCSTRGVVTINGASSYSWVLCETESFQTVRKSLEALAAGRSDRQVRRHVGHDHRRWPPGSVHARLHAAGVRQRTRPASCFADCRWKSATRRRSRSSRRWAAA